MAGTLLNLYGALGIDESASEGDVRSAYRRRALATHPDKGGEAEVFRLVVEAFEVLGDAARRATYDRKLRLLRGEGGRGHGSCASPASSSAAAPAAPAAAQASRTESAQQQWRPQAAASSRSSPGHAEARRQQAPSQGEASPKGGRSAATGAQPASTSDDCEAGCADRTAAEEILLKLMGMEKAAARAELHVLQAGMLRRLVALLSSEDQPCYNESTGSSGLPCTDVGIADTEDNNNNTNNNNNSNNNNNDDSESCSSGSEANWKDPEPLLAIGDAAPTRKRRAESSLPTDARVRGVYKSKGGDKFIARIGLQGVVVQTLTLASLDLAIDVHISLVCLRQLVHTNLNQGMDIRQAFSHGLSTVTEERVASGMTPVSLSFTFRYHLEARRVYFHTFNFDEFIDNFLRLKTRRRETRPHLLEERKQEAAEKRRLACEKRQKIAEKKRQEASDARSKKRRWLK
ncbi:unnamed protein product, partial [Polarella glacialis]